MIRFFWRQRRQRSTAPFGLLSLLTTLPPFKPQNRDVLAELGRKTAYVVCCSSAPLRAAARDAVDQLRGATRRRSHRGFARELGGGGKWSGVPGVGAPAVAATAV